MIKVWVSLLHGIVYVYECEIFPSEYRAIGVAIVTFMARMGNVLAPWLMALLDSKNILPQLSFGVSGIFGLLVTFCASETWGKDMKETYN
jgi:hypothetical protein